MTRRPAAVIAAATVALMAAVSLATVPERADAFPPVRPTRVLVLGDSVMKGAAAQYAAQLPGREVVVDAEVNRSTGQGADVVARLGTDWDVVVILLGHNDGGTPSAYQPAARRLLDQLAPVRRVSWLTIHEVRPYYPDVNRYIAGLQADYPNLRIGDWNAVADAHPDALAADGLHLNGQGAELMADLVANQVEIAELEWLAALRALAPTTTTAPPTTTTTAPPTTTTTTAPTTTRASTTTTTAAPTTSEVDNDCGASGEGTASCAEDDQSDGNAFGAAVTIGIVAVWVVVAVWGIRRLRRARRT